MEIKLGKLDHESASKIAKWKSDEDLSIKLMKKKENLKVEGAIKWIEKNNLDKNQSLNGIFLVKKNAKRLIGVARLMYIDFKSKVAELGIYIGEKKLIGRGLGYKAISLLIEYAFENLKLRKIFLKVNENNKEAIKLYKKMNFKVEGVMRQNYFNQKKGNFEAVIYMAAFNNEKYNY